MKNTSSKRKSIYTNNVCFLFSIHLKLFAKTAIWINRYSQIDQLHIMVKVSDDNPFIFRFIIINKTAHIADTVNRMIVLRFCLRNVSFWFLASMLHHLSFYNITTTKTALIFLNRIYKCFVSYILTKIIKTFKVKLFKNFYKSLFHYMLIYVKKQTIFLWFTFLIFK